MFRAETISITISRAYETVYDFLATPANLFTWIDIMGTQARPVAPLEWVAERPNFIDRPVTIRFSPRNAYGVLDIAAFLDGQQIYDAPVRAIRNGDGTEVMLTLIGRWGQTPEVFASELEWLRADLLTLKSVLEAG